MERHGLHVCLEQADAPDRDAEFPVDTRWECSCGSSYIYREGFNRAGYPGLDWWEVPPIAVPEQRRPSLRERLLQSRQG